MKIQFLGVGGAFAPKEQYQSNMVITADSGRKLLFDCGTDIKFSLADAGLMPGDIDAVYISHLHADHVGGLEGFAFYNYFVAKRRPKLFVLKTLLEPLWEHLKAGMQWHNDFMADLDAYFDVKIFGDNIPLFTWEDLNFMAVNCSHVGSMPVFGLLCTSNDTFITADTKIHADLRAYEMSDLIFHDCETYPTKSNVHAHYNDLKQLPESIKSKMWLYHYGYNATQRPEEDGFKGFVKKGQVFEIPSEEESL